MSVERRRLSVAIVRVGLGLALSIAPGARGDVVLDWNETLRAVAQADLATANPGWFTRSMAMLNGALYDAFQAVTRTHEPFLADESNPAASRDAAAIEAAYRVLLDCYPAQQSLLDAMRMGQLADIAEGPAKTAGIELGADIAQQYIDARADDGADAMVEYTPSTLPGRWRPDPLHPTQQAWGPEWGAVTTWRLPSSSHFPLPGVPALESQAYADAFAEIASLGALDSATRTLDQTRIGVFWGYDRPGLGPPPVLYDLNLAEIAEQQGNTPEQNARLFALASIALADAATACWDAKFADDFWRPITAIREGDTDGNSATEPDPAWTPLGAPGPDPELSSDDFTPPFPAYPSGHASMGGATFEALRLFYGTDAVAFTLHSAELTEPDDVRSFTSFSHAELENALSRIYLGIHWRFDVEDGVALGNEIATWVGEHHFQPVPEPGSAWTQGIAALALLAYRRRAVSARATHGADRGGDPCDSRPRSRFHSSWWAR